MEIAMCEEGGCRPYTPVKEWAEELKKAGFDEGTIVGADRHLTGNLRAAFPRARVIDAAMPPEAFPAPHTNGACLVVWRDTEFNEQRNIAVMPRELVAYLTDRLYAFPHDQGAEGAIRRNLHQSSDKAATSTQFVKPSNPAAEGFQADSFRRIGAQHAASMSISGIISS
jgi:hypothetical protein